MGFPEVPRGDEQQKVKSTAEPHAGFESQHIPSNPEQSHISPRPLAGQNGQTSPSPLRDDRKRVLPSIESFKEIKPPNTPRPEENWRRPSCGLLCWRCHSSFHGLPDPTGIYQNDDSDSESMESSSYTQSPLPTPNKKRKKCEELGIRFVGPKDPGFKQFILIACGALLDRHLPMNVEPNAIFGCQSKSPSSRVIISKDDKMLQLDMEDFEEYKERGYDEHTLSTICFDSIVLRDKFVDNKLIVDDKSIIRSVRRDKWRLHKQGPPIPGDTHTYDWDIEADTTYAVSVNIFDFKHRRELMLAPWYACLADLDSVCPYLTIEYKCSAKSGKSNDAAHQNAVASVIWLYQQKQILDALNLPLDDARHYSITIVDDIYIVREARFQDTIYHIRKLATGSLTNFDSLKKYVAWSNAIHTWGLGPNASAFKANIEKLIERKWNTEPLPT